MKLRLTPLDDCESHSLTSRTVRNIECCLVIQFELAFTVRGCTTVEAFLYRSSYSGFERFCRFCRGEMG
jgi:hypothetical protein